MSFKLIVIIILGMLSNYLSAQEVREDYYINLSREAISAAIAYYTAQEKCLQSEKVKKICVEDGFLNESLSLLQARIIKKKFLDEFLIISRTKEEPVIDLGLTLQQQREVFEYEAIYLQRRIPIFMEKVGRTCGETKAYDALLNYNRAIMEAYATHPHIVPHKFRVVNLNDAEFLRYADSMRDLTFKSRNECNTFLERNKKIYFSAYSDYANKYLKSNSPERALTFFLLDLMDELASEESVQK